jgi:hypothetical protein
MAAPFTRSVALLTICVAAGGVAYGDSPSSPLQARTVTFRFYSP